jgi:dimeric dUTPase (all-alpha-NTP-PPase superfamily)
MYKINKDPHDMLRQMFGQQEAFMELLQEERDFPEFPVDLTTKKGQKFLKGIAHDAMDELFEAIQHLKNSKDHRLSASGEVDRQKYLEELIDCLHYFYEVVIASGISVEELFEAYVKKGETNTQRILSGY